MGSARVDELRRRLFEKGNVRKASEELRAKAKASRANRDGAPAADTEQSSVSAANINAPSSTSFRYHFVLYTAPGPSISSPPVSLLPASEKRLQLLVHPLRVVLALARPCSICLAPHPWNTAVAHGNSPPAQWPQIDGMTSTAPTPGRMLATSFSESSGLRCSSAVNTLMHVCATYGK